MTNREIINLKTTIDFHEQVLAKLHQKLKELELPFEIAPKISEKRCNWHEAVEYCKFAGQDWRIPTLKELRMINVTYNDFEPEGVYWSQTGQDDCYVRCLNMRSGAREFHGKLRGTNYIRLIRYIK